MVLESYKAVLCEGAAEQFHILRHLIYEKISKIKFRLYGYWIREMKISKSVKHINIKSM